jgi:NAD-dependent SIR2 family protein deacetylase
VVVLSGAGLSTESGIPDYRGPSGAARRHTPMTYQEFTRDPLARRRYWARSHLGWQMIARAAPNDGHRAVARLQAAGLLGGIITQNVDGLHHAAGSERVVELHGSLASVRCLSCGLIGRRDEYQQRLLARNAGWAEVLEAASRSGSVEIAPDGDAELPAAALESFRPVECAGCGGTIKPDVVFFGENVPGARVEEAWRLYEEAAVLLVIGSSLTVYSGRRFLYRAQKEGVPIAIVNLGPTRADGMAAAKVEGQLGVVLPRVAEELLPSL